MKKYNEFVNKLNENHTYAVGDVVNIYYWVTKEPISVIIKEVKTVNNKKMYVVSFDLRSHQDMFNNTTVDNNFFNAPDMTITDNEIINTVSKIDTPAGPGWVSTNPNTQIAQVSNDMYM